MEPIQDKDFTPHTLSQTSKRHIVIPPFIPSAETGDSAPLELPAGLPILATDDFTWYTSTGRAKKLPDSSPSTPSPASRQPASVTQQQEQLSSSRLVRTLAQPTNHGQGTLYSQATSSYRWEQQTFRYPEELLRIMETETREMQVLTPETSAPSKSKRRSRRRKRRVPEMRQVTAVECGEIGRAHV